METNPAVGEKAPSFESEAVASSGTRRVRLEDLSGKRVVLYFYPKDDTPGCTVQACALRDGWSRVKEAAEIFGVSPDNEVSHQAFISKFDLPFELLSDPDHRIAEDYGVWVEKNRYGVKSMGVERSTFVIGEDGRILAILRRVKPEEHLGLLEAALGLRGQESAS